VIEIEIKGERIILRSGRPIAKLWATVPGSRFSKNGGPHWSVPLSIDACRALREKFGQELRVGAGLSDWAREKIAIEQEMHGLATAGDAVLSRVPEVSPVLAKAMSARTYQRVGSRFIARGHEFGGVLIADSPGLGKTLETIGGIIESGVPGPYLVVCPKTAVESVWAREIPRWWPGSSVVTVPDGRAKRDAIMDEFVQAASAPAGSDVAAAYAMQQTFVVVHPEMIRVASFWECSADASVYGRKVCGTRTKWKAGPKELDCGHAGPNAQRIDEADFAHLFSIEWGAIVVDESDRVLLRLTGTPTLARNGATLLPLREGGLRVAMSGTPFRSRPYLLWGTLNWLRPKEYSGFWRWCETFYEVDTNGYGGSRTIGRMREDKAKDLDFALRGIMLRRTKAEVAPDLPPKTYGGTPLIPGDETSPVGVWLELEPAQRKVYDRMEKESSVALEGGDLNAIGILAEITRLKQFATATGKLIPGRSVEDGQSFVPTLPSNKFNWLCEHLAELGYPDDPQTKVIVVSQFTSVLDMFAQELDRVFKSRAGWGGSCLLTGAVTGGRRTGTIDAFNLPSGSDSPHVMLLNVKAGGVAITIDSADEMVFLDETWIPDDSEQAEDRIHRVSKPRPVTYWYLRSLDTIEESIALVNMERRLDSHELLDGRRGVEYARRILERRR
jgi:SNF2 family DNA or RNA helicase